MPSEPENLEGLRELLDARYSLSIIGAHLVVNDVWYLDEQGELRKATLAAPLTQPTPTTVGAPQNHQMFWSGGQPHYVNGTPIEGLNNIHADLRLGEMHYTRHLSNKPSEGFSTYTLLVEHYVTLISGPVEAKFGVTARTGAVYDVPAETSPFKVRDTFSARAELTELNRRLADDRISIIGLGGTGAFVFDFMVKTPVHSIDAFDFDIFEVHNGFRSPGEVDFDRFGHPKTEVYRKKFEPFRHRLTFHKKRVAAGDESLFADTTFAFVCIDDGPSRAEICAMLVKLGIPFIDVGMGIENEGDRLDGLLRTTLFTPKTADQAIENVPLDAKPEEGAYRVFVQIAELNALNAAAAVIRYKQLRGFYADEKGHFHSLISLGLCNWTGQA